MAAISVTDRTVAPAEPARFCSMCGTGILMVLEGDHNIVACEYCDVGGNAMPPIGGFNGKGRVFEKDDE
jgi:hypothetical protein